MILKEINQNILRDLLDDAGLSTKKDEDGDLMSVINGDDDFPHDVVVWFIVDNNWLTVIARSFDFKVENSLAVANEYNASHRALCCVGEDEGVFFKFAVLLDEEVSTQFIMENCVRFAVGASWQGFSEIYKSLH